MRTWDGVVQHEPEERSDEHAGAEENREDLVHRVVTCSNKQASVQSLRLVRSY